MIVPFVQAEEWVAEAIEDLPAFLRQHINNLDFQVRPWPTPAEKHAAGVPEHHDLLGLYRGIPLTQRTSGYNLVPPDIIFIFQGPIEAHTDGSPVAIRELIRHTVWHEIAHHFGISDDRLRELGAY